ncbi:MAG: stage V sporulation T C-terminal domain-containing protein [Christensenellales bacterium]
MKTTGIVRRIDELGRVVIPKELRRTMHIKEGEEMEVFVAPDDSLVLKKYSPLKGMEEFCREYAEAVYRVTGHNCLVCDNDVFLACATDRAIYEGKRISKALEGLLSGRKAVCLKGNSVISVANEGIEYRELALAPLAVNGDVMGGIILLGKTPVGEGALPLITVASDFLSKQFI